MKAKEIAMLAGAAVAVYMLLRSLGSAPQQPQYWVTAQGNTGFPPEARTGSSGGMWV